MSSYVVNFSLLTLEKSRQLQNVYGNGFLARTCRRDTSKHNCRVWLLKILPRLHSVKVGDRVFGKNRKEGQIRTGTSSNFTKKVDGTKTGVANLLTMVLSGFDEVFRKAQKNFEQFGNLPKIKPRNRRTGYWGGRCNS